MGIFSFCWPTISTKDTLIHLTLVKFTQSIKECWIARMWKYERHKYVSFILSAHSFPLHLYQQTAFSEHCLYAKSTLLSTEDIKGHKA